MLRHECLSVLDKSYKQLTNNTNVNLDKTTMLISGCFFLACEDFGTMFDYSFPSCAFFFFFFFFNKVEISSRTLIPLFRPGSVHVAAQRAEMTVAKCSLTSCVWARVRIGYQTMPGQRHSQPIPTSVGEVSMKHNNNRRSQHSFFPQH